jgi:hypothetical protein
MFLVRYELGFYMTEGGILHSHRRSNFKYYVFSVLFALFPFIARASCVRVCVRAENLLYTHNVIFLSLVHSLQTVFTEDIGLHLISADIPAGFQPVTGHGGL